MKRYLVSLVDKSLFTMCCMATVCMLIFCASAGCYGSNLIVCHIKGEILDNGNAIRVGTEIEYDDRLELQFSSLRDEAVVSPEKARYIITARNYKIVNGKIRVPVRDNFMPCPTLRPDKTNAPLTDITDVLYDGRVSMLDSIMVPLDETYTRNASHQYFVVSYNYEGETIRKKISYNPEYPYLTLSNKLFDSSGGFIDPSLVDYIELYLFDTNDQKAMKMGNLKITSLLSENTVQELRVLVNGVRAYTNNDEDLLLLEVRSHIAEFYGTIRDAAVERYLRMLTGG